jgi:hypothetical protein
LVSRGVLLAISGSDMGVSGIHTVPYGRGMTGRGVVDFPIMGRIFSCFSDHGKKAGSRLLDLPGFIP